MMQRERDPAQTAVRLEPFTESDVERLLGWIEPTEAFLIQWAGRSFAFPVTRDQLVSVVRQTRPPSRLLRVLEEGEDVIGHAELHVDSRHAYARISRLLVAPHARGRGLGQALTRALVDLALVELGLHRVELGVIEFNTAALRAYEAVGFRKEGTLRESRRIGSRHWSVIEMAILRREWRADLAT